MEFERINFISTVSSSLMLTINLLAILLFDDLGHDRLVAGDVARMEHFQSDHRLE